MRIARQGEQQSLFRKDSMWPDRCTVFGCTKPEIKPHHHHIIFRGQRMNKVPCICGNIEYAGTRP